MRRHPSIEVLLALHEADPRQVESAAQAHVDHGCEQCRSRLAQIRVVLSALGSPPLRTAPTEWVDVLLKRIGDLEAQEVPHKPTLGAWLVQSKALGAIGDPPGLVLDSSLSATAGIRGVGAADSRQLLFESPGCGLHLRTTLGQGVV
jgi:hypothetical protein